MPTLFTHPAIPLAVRAWTGGSVTPRRLALVAALCSVVPDIDSLGFFAGVPYESLFGHRGFTHSLAFALLLASCAMPIARWLHARRWWVFALVFLSTISHGVLDALTDDGLGIAFLSPFSNRRFFFPWRPIPTSPIGIGGFFSPDGMRVLGSEILFIWLPCLLVAAAPRMGPRLWAIRNRLAGALVAVGFGVAGAYAAAAGSDRQERTPAKAQAMLTEAIENLQLQARKLAALGGSACPQDFSELEGSGTLRVSLFWGYDEHEGKVHDRANAGAMLRTLTDGCRGRELSTCGFSLVSRSESAATLARTLGDRRVEVNLFTTSLPADAEENESLVSAYLEQNRLSRAIRARFYRELVDSDVVFYMGHSRLGGGMGFENQTGITTLVNAVLRLPLQPVLEALRRRPTRLKVLGMFSCRSEEYFRRAFQDANPSLSLILTTGDIGYLSGEQTSLGALEAILSKYCGFAFLDSMTSVTEYDPRMTYLIRGR